MAWFKVTVGWAEKDPATGLARWKFRFEKLDTTEDGWWAGGPSVESEHPEEMVMGTCRTCKTESPHIYKEGWMCLDQECSQFWQVSTPFASYYQLMDINTYLNSLMVKMRLQSSNTHKTSYSAEHHGP